MKALTISQPFASLIADGHKWIENRTWQTHYRGPLAIHAGSGTQYLTRRELTEYPQGILATCELVACFRLADVPRLGDKLAGVGFTIDQILTHEHAEGPWCWLLRNVTKLPSPIACRGERGLWEWHAPTDLVSA